jgi:hypothetical protein
VSNGVIALWSAPRCRSTAFLRMMMERQDVIALHEPFSHLMDFGEARVRDRVVHSEHELMATLTEFGKHARVFFKDTTDFHYPGLLADGDFLRAVTHCFLIREPRAAIASHVRLNPALTQEEVGFARLHEIFVTVRGATGTVPLVMDSEDLLHRPEALVEAFCAHVGLPFVPAALTWRPEMREEWQRTARWHRAVGSSSGFQQQPQADLSVVDEEPRLQRYYEYHLPYYEELHAQRWVG